MRKQILIAIAITSFLLVPTLLATVSSGDDFLYHVNPLVVQVSPDTTIPDQIPNCKTSNTAVPTFPTINCLSPAFIRTAYNFTGAYAAGLSGAGQTIVIVDAFGSPTITFDLARFDTIFGIPAPPSFTILCPDGGCPQVPIGADRPHDRTGWAFETTLDVEWAHAVAPGANIVLAVAATSSGNAINDIETKAISLNPNSIFSQSFGIPEGFVHNNNAQIMQAQSNYGTGTAAGITFIASSGDSGASNGFPFANPIFPSSSPLNLAVGGTQGNPLGAGLVTFTGTCPTNRRLFPSCTPTGYGSEAVWNEPWIGEAGGGAPSLLFGTPSYQSSLGFSSRTTPDVSYNAAVDGGVLAFTSFLGFNAIFIFGGTSAGSPQWAGIIALANQARANVGKSSLGLVNPFLYSIFGNSAQYARDFHDITMGNNILAGTGIGFSAGTGYDLGSGIGTSNVGNLVADLTST